MLNSLYSGTTGIKANSLAMGIIGSNIANVNTIGFKTGTASFANILSENLADGGVQIWGMNESWSQGSLQHTNKSTDLAVIGQGLFMIADKLGQNFYTRAGSFNFNQYGNLVNEDNLLVQGYKIGSDGGLGEIGTISIASLNSPPSATSEMNMNFNLDGQFVAANLTIEGSNDYSGVTYTAGTPGTDGNNISVRYIDSTSGGLSVTTSGNAITVDFGGATPTAKQVAEAINNVEKAKAKLTVGSGTASITFTAVENGYGGNKISVKYIKSGTGGIDVDVSGNVITVDIGSGTFSAAAVAKEINEDTEASALVSAAAGGGGAGAVVVSTVESLSGGKSSIPLSSSAELTVGSATASMVTFTAVDGSSGGNDISVEYKNSGSGGLSVTVSGDAITVDLGSGTHTAEEVVEKINGDTLASALVSAAATDGTGSGNVAVSSEEYLSGGKPLVSAAPVGNGSGVVEICDPQSLSGGAQPSDFTTTTTVYDSLGNPVNLSVDFTYDSDEAQWNWNVRSSAGVADGYGIIKFDSSGQLDTVNSKWDAGTPGDPPDPSKTLKDDGNPEITITALTSGAANISIDWDMTELSQITGFSAPSAIRSQGQNGYSTGDLIDVKLADDGKITGIFSNGKSDDIYQVGLAGFANYQGLTSIGDNLYQETVASGKAVFGLPNGGGRGAISSGALEMSNVDLADEFVKMITVQRAYQANSKVVVTSDQILQDLINMKR